MRGLRERVESVVLRSSARVRELFEITPEGAFVNSFDHRPGVWETAEALSIVVWRERDEDLLNRAVHWLAQQQHLGGGYDPSPDISYRAACIEPTTRVLLSLLPASDLLGRPRELEKSGRTSVDWIIANQNADGGWGAHLGLPSRIFPTSFAMQALTLWRSRSTEAQQAVIPAISRAEAWLRAAKNDDGGYGARARQPSTAPSSGHAAVAFTRIGRVPPESLHSWLKQAVEANALSDIHDDIGSAHVEQIGGRLQFLTLANPLALSGLMCTRAAVFDESAIVLLERILASANDGLWYIPDGRFIWPTYFHVSALRAWSTVHDAIEVSTTIRSSISERRHTTDSLMWSSSPSERPSVFISHRGSQDSIAIKLARVLELAGYRPWVDDQEILPGDVLVNRIRGAITSSQAIIFLVSKDFSEERWIKSEIEIAERYRINNEKFRIIAIEIDGGNWRERIPEIAWATAADTGDLFEIALKGLSGLKVR